MTNKPTYKELENRIADLKKQNEILKLSESSDDITERKQAEKERFRLLDIIEKSLNEIYVFDAATLKFDYLNQGALQNIGYTNNEMKNLTPVDIKPEFTDDTFKQAIEPLRTGEKAKLVFETIHKRKNGTDYPVEVHLQLHKAENKNLFFAIINDTTERKQSEKEKEKLFHDLGERMKELKCLYDIAKVIETPGVTLEQISKETLHILPSAWQYPEITCAKITIDNWEYRTDNFVETKWKQSADITAQEEIVGAITVCYLEEKTKSDEGPFLKEERRLLEAVAERLGNIVHSMHIEKALIENQRLGAIGEMASSVAHDFNNSLQAMYGNIELAIRNSGIDKNILPNLETIKTIVDDAAARVKLLQRFSGNNQTKREYSEVNIKSLIEEVLEQTRPLWKDDAEKKGLSFTVTTKYTKIPDIFGNTAELRTALFNVLKNSIEAMPLGGIISIETGKKSKTVFITITDSGTGMDQETKTKIFQPFYSTKGFEIGRGLGMSSVYGTVKEHNGNIYIKNTALGEGTSIEILLPFSQEKKRKEKGVIPAVGKEYTANKSLAKVLWVEDDHLIRTDVGNMLKMNGYTAKTASSGKKALEYLEKDTYDIVITDIGMPEMNGWQLADIIKEKYKGKIPVAVVTGWGSEIDDVKMKQHGVLHVIAKPFMFNQIEKLLKDLS